MSMRTILHSDANCFYASVEMLLNPSLRGKAVAVCGSEDDRHGIVLAKSEQAKRAGVKTGQANWEARQACPGLICVPPHYEQYNKFSILLRNMCPLMRSAGRWAEHRHGQKGSSSARTVMRHHSTKKTDILSISQKQNLLFLRIRAYMSLPREKGAFA